MSETRKIQLKNKRKSFLEKLNEIGRADYDTAIKEALKESKFSEAKQEKDNQANLQDSVQDTAINGKKGQANLSSEIETPKKDVTYPQFLEYDAPSDEELYELAKKSVEDKKASDIQDLVSSKENSEKSINKAINDQIEGAKSKKENQKSNYLSSLKQIEDQVLKRGIARSSIAVNAIGGLEKQNMDILSKIDSDSVKEIASLNEQISALESEFAKKLSSINEKYANAINTKLAELKKERDEKLQSIIKYNNSLALSGFGGITGGVVDSDGDGVIDTPVISNADLRRVSEVVTSFLQYDDPTEALTDFLSDDSYRDYLGTYYNNVYTILYNRAKASAGQK